MKKSGFIVILVVLMLIAIPTIVQAGPWSALSSGYAITTNWHGIDVPIGESVTAWAGTTDSTVNEVNFIWKDPDENVASELKAPIFVSYQTPNVPGGVPQEIVDWANNNPGIDVYYATNTYNPADWTGTVIGDWGVQAEFWGPDGKLKGTGNLEGIVKIKATSFFAIPEATGTLTILLAMFASLAIFARKRF